MLSTLDSAYLSKKLEEDRKMADRVGIDPSLGIDEENQEFIIARQYFLEAKNYDRYGEMSAILPRQLFIMRELVVITECLLLLGKEA